MNDNDVRTGQARPSIARTYDYLLGGRDHYVIDEEFGRYFEKVLAGSEQIAISNRGALELAVRALTHAGVDQIIDFGCGLPAQRNVHQIAREQVPGSRVVYLDNDPIVVSHGQAMLVVDDDVAVVQADVRDPESIRKHPEVQRLISFDRPVGLLFSVVLGFLEEDADPIGPVRYWVDVLAPGSFVYVSCFRAGDNRRTALVQDQVRKVLDRGSWHSDATIAAIFEGLEMIGPGVVPCVQWRPDGSPGPAPTDWEQLIVSGLARKN
ncbi:SAM-dependent methyltransferase [Nocardia sp. alder85J]|uniref:SAM-dependent methyltransferase n=1 Tax=Nocardia sp. alder85J TaxID=2862949 RepID=UPI001CD53929|nr:SAM-dependent methyltransferase [Nocardia sp. alder85J]MCX4094293.1 SAM-dependent methyltransferase [Nocardia sp. alder85J]